MNLDRPRYIQVGFLCAAVSAILFGSISTIAKPTLSSVNPIFLASLVYLVSAIILSPIAHKSKGTTGDKRSYFYIILIAIFGGVIAPILYFLGLEQTSASDTAVLTDAELLFTVILALVFFKEKLNRVGYLSVVLVITGVIIVTTNLQFTSLFETSFGNLLILLSTVFWALDNNISRIITQKISNVARIAQIKSAIGGSIVLGLVFLFGIPIEIDPALLPNIILLGVGGFGVALFFFLKALQRIGAIKTLMIFSISSPVGLVFAAIFLGETISLYQIIAISVILVGIFLIYSKGEKPVDTKRSQKPL
ncbi:MAG: DMT family transporter [Nitrosopumilaceae archaeon]